MGIVVHLFIAEIRSFWLKSQNPDSNSFVEAIESGKNTATAVLLFKTM